jgi:hypothetical protein
MAPRLANLDGKTIYLVSDGFPGADIFLAKAALLESGSIANASLAGTKAMKLRSLHDGFCST